MINPATPNTARISLDFDLKIDYTGRFPPIGLISLAAYIREHSKHNIEIVDCDAEEVDIVKHIKNRDVDIIGIISFTYTFFDVLQLCRLIKMNFSGLPIVVGGPHTPLFPRETLSHTEIDYLVIGEGEEAFLYLLNKIENGQVPDKIEGLAFRNGKEIFVGSPAWINKLDDLPFPAYDLLKPDKYHATFGYGGKTITLCTSRGCPFNCTFCQSTKKFRANSLQYIMEYITSFHKQGYRNFYFFDDTFNITASRVIEFSRAVRAEKLKIKWIFRGRVDGITEELCREASLAGCVQMLLGIEDYTNEGLLRIKKRVTIEKAEKAVACAKRYGIKTNTNWIIGLPSHKTLSDLEELVRTAINIKSDFAMFSLLTLLPGCELFEEAAAEGVIKRTSWYDYVSNPVPKYQIEFYDKYISGEELTRFYASAYRKYYRRPGYILQRMLDLRSFSELKNKIPMALKILLQN